MKKITSFICLIIFMFSFPALGQVENSDIGKQEILQEVKEVKYVTDKLRLSLYKKADSNSGTLKLLISGDVLDVLEKSGPYSKVRTSEGEIGWVKNGFLVSIPTASFLLIEEEKKNEELSILLAKFSNTQKIVDDYENTIEKLNVDKESTEQELINIQQQFDKMSEQNSELKQEIEAYSENSTQLNWKEILIIIRQYWYVLTVLALLLYLFGFMMGKQMVQAQVRKRFQGVKVL